MFDYDALFDVRSNVGIKLEALLAERNYTKAQLCKETGVSRPTIDKVLAGTITSKANFVRHIAIFVSQKAKSILTEHQKCYIL